LARARPANRRGGSGTPEPRQDLCGGSRDIGNREGHRAGAGPGNNYWPPSYSAKTGLICIPALSNCSTITIDREKHTKEKGWKGKVGVPRGASEIDPAPGHCGAYWRRHSYSSHVEPTQPPSLSRVRSFACRRPSRRAT
jgi:hypothetical protein